MKEFLIKNDAAGQRLDRYLSKLMPLAKKTEIQKWIRIKTIKVNGKKQDSNYRLIENDIVVIYLSDLLLEKYMQEKIILSDTTDLDIVYEDDNILIVNKPEGLLVHPNKEEYKNTLSSKVQYYLKHLCTKTFTVSSVNRLDKNTSGLVLFCKNYDSLKYYNELMKEKKIKKKYISIVEGRLLDEKVIEGYLLKNEEKNKVYFSKYELENSKYIKTIVKPIEMKKEFTKVEIELITGRTHQIRVSLKSIGFPIIGDIKYGGKKVFGLNHQLLVANILEFENKKFEIKNEKIEEIWSKLC